MYLRRSVAITIAIIQQARKDISLFLQFYETEHVRKERGKKDEKVYLINVIFCAV